MNIFLWFQHDLINILAQNMNFYHVFSSFMHEYVDVLWRQQLIWRHRTHSLTPGSEIHVHSNPEQPERFAAKSR